MGNAGSEQAKGTDREDKRSEVTRIIHAIQQGDVQATDKLLPLVYEELRHLAAWKLTQEPSGQTLQATALVHEVYLRLVGSENQHWDGRGHFFAAAAEAMRKILVENARRKQRLKRGGSRQRVELDDADLAIEMPSDDILALDEALSKLDEEDRIVADLVRMRFFAGLSLEQIAKVLGISRRTADRYWAYGRAWLRKEITRGESNHSP